MQFKKRMGVQLGIGGIFLMSAVMNIATPKNVEMKVLLQGGLVKDSKRGGLLLRVLVICAWLLQKTFFLCHLRISFPSVYGTSIT